MYQEEARKSLTEILYGGTIAFLFLAAFVLFLVYLFLQKRKQSRIEKELLQSRFAQTLLQAQLEIQEQTLQQIGQEIHDNTSQLLGLIKLNIATTDPDKPELAKKKLAETNELVARVIADLRQLSHTLDTGFIGREGLGPAIAYQLELLERTGLVSTGYTNTGPHTNLASQTELILFRMVQEMLNNSLKHAKASEITVALTFSPTELRITVTDNGQGFDATKPVKGIGLQNLDNRAKLIQAQLLTQSSPGAGTAHTIIYTIPAALS
jgi:two-component system, NarL family, sensor kinase